MVHQIDRRKMSKKGRENICLTETVHTLARKAVKSNHCSAIKIKPGEKEERLKVRDQWVKFRSSFCRLEWHDQPKFGL